MSIRKPPLDIVVFGIETGDIGVPDIPRINLIV